MSKTIKNPLKKPIAALTLLIVCLLSVSMAANAQSSEASYPYGYWVQDSDPTYRYILTVGRHNGGYTEFGFRTGCGILDVYNKKEKRLVYHGLLNYIKRTMYSVINGKPVVNTMSTSYQFKVENKRGFEHSIVIEKQLNKDPGNSPLKIIISYSVYGKAGDFKDFLLSREVQGKGMHSAKRITLYSATESSKDTFDPTWKVMTDDQLLKELRYGALDKKKYNGYLDLDDYIDAHKHLIPGYEVYARPIEGVDAFLYKWVGGLSSGLMDSSDRNEYHVCDEYNGWVYVNDLRMRFNWVKLSQVELYNHLPEGMQSRDHEENNGKENAWPPPMAKRKHNHSFQTEMTFSKPQEVKVKEKVKFNFPEEITIVNGVDTFIFKKCKSNIGDNVYLNLTSRDSYDLPELETVDDAKLYLAYLNDSLKNAGEHMTLRLPTIKELNMYLGTSTEGLPDYYPYFKPLSATFALEYNEDKSGNPVVGSYVTVRKTVEQKCSCGQIRRYYTDYRFKNKAQANKFINECRNYPTETM